jgi:hypothetical protein
MGVRNTLFWRSLLSSLIRLTALASVAPANLRKGSTNLTNGPPKLFPAPLPHVDVLTRLAVALGILPVASRAFHILRESIWDSLFV